MVDTKSVSSCEIIELHGFLGSKWTIPLLHYFEKPHSFNEINKKTKKLINPTLLSNRLKTFEKFKILKKEVINNKTIYSLTTQGKKLKDVLHEIKDWAITNKLGIPKGCIDKCECDELFN
ncbi:helix-turn-helix transcriptional regulator [Candidatus Woesearchaeota archaeon]|nr:helix-turn-helix transcriptional regulator [Candidatus Woesearchaeota archaeon]